MHSSTSSLLRVLALASMASILPLSAFAQSGSVITGQAAFTDYTQEHPGVIRKITLADLPEPMPDESVDNGPSLVPRPEGAWPVAPAGFKVQMYAQGFTEPRLIRTAPNGDIFLADSRAGQVKVLRGVGADGKATTTEVFASGLDHPFGIAFYPSGDHPKWVYVANTTSVVRFPYKEGDLKASAAPEVIVPVLPGYAQLRGGGHWTRGCSSPSDRPRTWTIPTLIRGSFTVPTCWSFRRKGSS
jgi:glucose/arabinose dehydrogenase